jgi:putative heme iron utilization protein
MPYATDASGSPIFLISSMAVHAHNIAADERASLFVAQPGITDDPLGAARVTVMGKIAGARAEARDLYLARHPGARAWIDFQDFSLVTLGILDVYYIGGFGVMGWITADEYNQASPDPLADAAPGILEHVNTDHAGAVLELARTYAGIEADEARITAVDRLGFELRLRVGERVQGARIAFLAEVSSVAECRTMFMEMSRRATDRGRNA